MESLSSTKTHRLELRSGNGPFSYAKKWKNTIFVKISKKERGRKSETTEKINKNSKRIFNKKRNRCNKMDAVRRNKRYSCIHS